MTLVGPQISAVIVDFHAGEALVDCVTSLRSNGVDEVVVVENGKLGSSRHALEMSVTLVEPGLNLGYGRGVNRGAAATVPKEYLLVSNPDVIVHEGAVATLIDYLDARADVGVVGPKIVRRDGTVYPSGRIFPNMWLAGLHAVLEPFWPKNPATLRYRRARDDGTVDWVSGAFFVIRRSLFEAIGGFDERYFMFAEEMALCWQVRRSGYNVAYAADAVVTHLEGVSRALAPREMVIAHHRSALRFEFQTARGVRRLFAPLAAAVIGLRLLLVMSGRSHHRR